MSTWITQANPNPRKAASIQPPHVSIPNKGTPQPAIGTPRSATAATQMNSMAANPPLVVAPRSSKLIFAHLDNPAIEDFGRDKDLKNLLKNLQPKAFTGEGSNIPKILEE